MSVIPIIIPLLDWATLARSSDFGDEVWTEIDKDRLLPDSPQMTMSLVSMFHGIGALDHLCFSFLVKASGPIFWELGSFGGGRLTVSIRGHEALISGSLRTWRDLLAEDNDSLKLESCEILNAIHLSLENMGLRLLWKDYSKETGTRGVFKLKFIG